MAHLALSARARGRPLPRWFHEGVATSVDAGWDLSGQLRLLFEMSKGPGTADLGRLFSAGSQPDAALVYALSAALVADLQRRHGAGVAGEIAAHVGEGVGFARAFEMVTSESPDAAAGRAWGVYRTWTAWVPALTGGTAVWAAILGLAAAAYAVRRRRRVQRRQQWDDEGSGGNVRAMVVLADQFVCRTIGPRIRVHNQPARAPMRQTTMTVLVACLVAATSASADRPLDCTKHSLADAVADVGHKAAVITFTGVCAGPVVIRADGVTLQGIGEAIIDGGGEDAVSIAGAGRVSLAGVEIRNGRH